MSVDVVYQGLTIARGAGTKVTGRELFIETEGPMPVATALTVTHGGHSLASRVSRVVEGVGAGMVLVPAQGDALPAWLTQMRPQQVETVTIEADSEYDDPPAKVAPAPPVVQAAPPAPEPEPEVREMIAEPPPSTVTPEPVETKAEATVEFAIPDGELDAESSASDKKTASRSSKKKSKAGRR